MKFYKFRDPLQTSLDISKKGRLNKGSHQNQEKFSSIKFMREINRRWMRVYKFRNAISPSLKWKHFVRYYLKLLRLKIKIS